MKKASHLMTIIITVGLLSSCTNIKPRWVNCCCQTATHKAQPATQRQVMDAKGELRMK